MPKKLFKPRVAAQKCFIFFVSQLTIDKIYSNSGKIYRYSYNLG